MESIQFRNNLSTKILLRMIIVAAASAALLIWKLDFINDVYFRNQLTATGLIINGSIMALFLLGLLKIIWILVAYGREESAVKRFVENLEENVSPLIEVNENSIMARRYRTMEHMHQANTPVNHNALASTLVASESTRNSFPKFINNILILTGVFGTIVSLSIALIGASDLLASAVNVDGMGLVVHGMSTALSTTITAIVCYIYFGYFYLKLTDVQTNLVSAVEQVTNNYLLPRFQVQTESILYEFTGLIRSLQGLVNQMEGSQESYNQLADEMKKSQQAFEDLENRIGSALVDIYKTKIQPVADDMNDIKKLLKIGFRLPE
ncbi:MotA/TolQ/ExbB proton channel family protein [Solemya velesiana gill symbiont]|uniref:MotA/TolQ/ExbB proton channel domain-containing protein n=1 Tax=Solemya velesiana gill symbiont TaxID=1918948 RepID=A0A1T2KSR5_9GAMM|nr:MotA/TolQ/ExbB proton channel family protein [Solemya velesiana gill symbiont]OOZ35831.1 hypothetical protein BOW51_10145 [Solemya velesiana gill symbiont]